MEERDSIQNMVPTILPLSFSIQTDTVSKQSSIKMPNPCSGGRFSQQWPESFTKRRRNERATFLGAEYAVVIGANVRHADIQPSLRDLGNCLIDVGTQR